MSSIVRAFTIKFMLSSAGHFNFASPYFKMFYNAIQLFINNKTIKIKKKLKII